MVAVVVKKGCRPVGLHPSCCSGLVILVAEYGADAAGGFEVRVVGDDLYVPAIGQRVGDGRIDHVRHFLQLLIA